LVWQHVLPDVLWVREPCLRRADPSQDSQLATPLQVLSLVSHFFLFFIFKVTVAKDSYFLKDLKPFFICADVFLL
jgi:hypothetical protein